MKLKLIDFFKSIPFFVWLTALIYSLIYFAYYKFHALQAPNSWYWVGGVGGDDSVYLGLMQFVVDNKDSLFSAVNPWHTATDPGSAKILLTPEFSSPYWFYFLGLVAKFSGIAAAKVMMGTRIFLAGLLPLTVWLFLRTFLPEKQEKKSPVAKISFILFHFSFGLGGLIFLAFSFFKEGHFNLIPFWPFTAMGNALTYEMFEGTGLQPLTFLGRTYYLASFIAGLSSLIFLEKAVSFFRDKKHRIHWGITGGLFLALSQAIYPITGVGFVILAFVWLIVFKQQHLTIQVRQTVSERKIYFTKLTNHLGLAAFFAFAALGGLPWFASLLADKTHFVTYGQLKVNATPLPLIISTATLLIPTIIFVRASLQDLGYAISRGLKGVKKIFAFHIFAEAVLLSTGVFPLRTVLIFVLGALIALLSLFFWNKSKKVALFAWFWLLFAFFASIMPIRDWTPFLPARFMLLMWLPLAILGAYFLTGVTKKVKGNLLLVTILILSIPSAFFYTSWFLRKPLKPDVYAQSKGDGGESLRPEYIKEKELEALNFLKSQPQGVVLCNYEIGMYLPLLSGKQSLLGRDPMVYKFSQKREDYRKFFEAGTQVGEAGRIIEKYGLGYIVFGPEERTISNDLVTMKNFADHIELIAAFGEGKNEKIEVWKVKK